MSPTPTSAAASPHSAMTLSLLAMLGGGRLWNWSPKTTGSLRCQGTSADTFLPVICASTPKLAVNPCWRTKSTSHP